MVLSIICKKREKDGKKWTNYSANVKGIWYNVKFVKDCAPPQVHAVDTNILRAFIDLKDKSKFDIATDKSSNSKTLFVEGYESLTQPQIDDLKTKELAKIEEYRKAREAEKMDFLEPDEPESPF